MDPAHAGMIPCWDGTLNFVTSGPRACGDESNINDICEWSGHADSIFNSFGMCSIFCKVLRFLFFSIKFYNRDKRRKDNGEKEKYPLVGNAIAYTMEGIVLPCPRCGSTDIEITVLQEGRKSITLVCRKCGDWRHFDGEK